MRVADLIVRSLEAHGIARAYCVPGESYLALLDALHDSSVRTIVCRHESGAGFMALAEAKMTGRPAVFMVSRGPGATNGSIAVHVAEQDALPVLLLVGQVARAERGRGAFQEVDYTRFFGGIAKGVFEILEADRAAEIMVRAFHLAASGVPGPVVIVLPEDVLADETETSPANPFPVVMPHHAPEDLAAIQSLIDAAARPVVIAGALLRGQRGAAALSRFAEAQRLPVATSWKNQDVFDNTSSLFAGHIGFGAPKPYRDILTKADLIVAAGTRLGDVTSLNYSFPAVPEPAQQVIHIYPDARPIGRVSRPALGLIADPITVLEALGHSPRVVSSARESWISAINGFSREFMAFRPRNPDDGVDFGEVIAAIAEQAPKDTVIATDAGNMSTWVHRHWPMSPRNLLIGGIAGAMGLGVPAAVAAQLVDPTRTAIVVVGDGGILMTGQEIATAIQYGAKPKIVLSDNGTYGTIRSHQEREFPNRVSGTDLANPDFTAWARSFGAHAITIERGDDVAAKVAEALAQDGATVIHVKSSRESLSAYATMSQLRGE